MSFNFCSGMVRVPVCTLTCIPRHVILSAGLSNFLELMGKPRYDSKFFNDRKSLEAF